MDKPTQPAAQEMRKFEARAFKALRRHFRPYLGFQMGAIIMAVSQSERVASPRPRPGFGYNNFVARDRTTKDGMTIRESCPDLCGHEPQRAWKFCRIFRDKGIWRSVTIPRA